MKDGILNPTNTNFYQVIAKNRRHISFAANQKIIFTEHCWIDRNRLIGCTLTGEMYYFQDNQLNRTHENAFNNEESHSYIISIIPFSKGFFLGSSEGEMAMWVRQEENQSTTGKNAYDFIS